MKLDLRSCPVDRLRLASLLDGVSYLVLLGAAMPLKYFAGMPMAVTIVGMAHGVLFIIFCMALALAMKSEKWPFQRGVFVFAAALIPFGPFLIDGRLKGWDENPEPAN